MIAPHLWDTEEILWCDVPETAAAVAVASARQGLFKAIAAISTLAIVFLYLGIDWLGKDDAIAPGAFILVLGGIIVGTTLLGRTAVAWLRGRLAARRMAYGVTNRRVLIVQGDLLDWVGPRTIEDVVLRGDNVVVTRSQSELEALWSPEAPGFSDDDAPGQGFIDKVNQAHREMTLAAIRDPQHVLALVQTLQQRTAS